MMWTSLCLFFY